MKKSILLFLLLSSLSGFSQSVYDFISSSPNHTTLTAAIDAAGLDGTLSGPGTFTVFAPDDNAFLALPPGTVDALLMDPSGDLTEVLLYHVLGTEVLSGALFDGQMANTLQGEDVTVTIDMGNFFINDAQVTLPNQQESNGVVHVIDGVLLPQSILPETVVEIIVNSDVHETLEAAVIAAELADDLSGAGPFTVFAPTDAAFDLLPAGTVEALLMDPTGDLAEILLYHVLSGEVLAGSLTDGQMAMTLQGEDITVSIVGEDVFINDAQVIITDLMAQNGVVHVINAVLLPQSFLLPETVVEVINDSPIHTILQTAISQAGLADDLSGEGPFTVFAPTDEAFGALPAGTVEELLLDPMGDLAEILLYHVLSGEVLAGSLTDGQMAMTLQGEDITVTITGEDVFINNALVIVADIMTQNGVVHVIDAVLLPAAFVGVEELNSSSSVKVGPNPASDVLNIQFTEALNDNVQINIFDLNGRTVKQEVISDLNSSISTSDLPVGSYIMTITSQDYNFYKKIMIAK